jgi:hypothetical protein
MFRTGLEADPQLARLRRADGRVMEGNECLFDSFGFGIAAASAEVRK